jgi:hypothetical protein
VAMLIVLWIKTSSELLKGLQRLENGMASTAQIIKELVEREERRKGS